MSRQYKKLTGIELIKSHCRVIIEHALKNDLETDGINPYVMENGKFSSNIQVWNSDWETDYEN